MHSEEGPNGVRPDEEDAESFGTLRLAGIEGRFRTLLSDEGLKLSRTDGRGLRLSLSAIDSIRITSKPGIPSGWIVISLLLLVYGVRLAPPSSNVFAIGISGIIISIWLVYRKDVLRIDAKNGDRHRIHGRTEKLIRLKKHLELMLEGVSLLETRTILQISTSNEPSVQDEILSSMHNEMNLAKALATHAGIGGFRDTDFEPQVSQTVENEFSFDPTMFETPSSPFSFNGQHATMPDTGIFGSAHRERASIALTNTNTDYRDASNAFAAPSIETQASSSDDGGIFGNLFDSIDENKAPTFESQYGRPSIQEDLELAQRTYAEVTSINNEERHLPVPTRAPSSMQLIRQAQEQFGPPSSTILPPPAANAVREECQSSGLVSDAKREEIVEAELIIDGISQEIPNELSEFPSLSRMLRRPDHQSRLIIKGASRSRSSTVMNLLRSFRPQNATRRAMGLLRLRSDQDYQAQRSAAIGSMTRNHGKESNEDGYSAAMESIAATISQRDYVAPASNLKLDEMNPTKNSEDDSQYPGMRRLG